MCALPFRQCYFHNFLLVQVDVPQAAICVVASQIANFGESMIGALLQGKDGFGWVSSYFNHQFTICVWVLVFFLSYEYFLSSNIRN